MREIHTKNADYQKFVVLKTNRNKRHKYGQFIVEGVRNINEAIRNNWRIDAFLYPLATPLSCWAAETLGRCPAAGQVGLEPDLMAELSGKDDTSELMAVVQMRDDGPESLSFVGTPLLALFDRPSNKGNLGTLIRTCDALGVDALVLTGHGVDLYDPDTIAASMGSFFKLPVFRLADNASVDAWIGRLKGLYADFQVFGASSHASLPIYEQNLTVPLLFMIGNETDGLCNHFKEICDSCVTIPMAQNSSASSFNVACASTVLFYEAVRQRLVSAR